MSDLATTKSILGDLIAHPSISSDSNLPIIDDLANRLSDAGARVEVLHSETMPGKANLFATIGPEAQGGIVLSGHSDVVPVADQAWSSDPFEMVERDGALYGRGTCDMKGFIAACVAKAPDFAAQTLRKPIHFAFTHDEETGCLGAQDLVETLDARGLRPDIAIIGEPTEMRIIEGHKGCCEYTTSFTGLEGHGSRPDLGVNAVEYAARYVIRLMELAEDLKSRAPNESRFAPPWTTIGVGALIGGVAHNVIPGRAEVKWDMRPVQDSDRDFVLHALEDFTDKILRPEMQARHPHANISTHTIAEVIGLEPENQNRALALVSALTGANSADVVAFGTEAGLFRKLGLSAVVCGPGSIAEAHKPDEFIAISELSKCLNMLDKLETHLRA